MESADDFMGFAAGEVEFTPRKAKHSGDSFTQEEADA